MSIETSPIAADLDGQIIEITELALEKVLEVLAGEEDAGTLGLRIEVIGTNGPEYQYDLSFEEIELATADDARQVHGELTVVIPADSVEQLRGATLDLPAATGQGGLVIRNPNRPDPMAGVKDLSLEGDTAQKINQLLEEAINPSLASHGGFATLLGVDGEKAYLTMGGGCQGCSMSQATMVQGIASAIREAIPEITEVIDATDHTAGENPFYT